MGPSGLLHGQIGNNTHRSNMNRHMVDLSSGSTCCSSSTSSSPHTLMQVPPVPSLPQSITQGVMLFADLTTVDNVSSAHSPSHFGSHHTQYAHPYHPYLNSHTASTIPRHYDAMSTSTSPLKLYNQDPLMVLCFLFGYNCFNL